MMMDYSTSQAVERIPLDRIQPTAHRQYHGRHNLTALAQLMQIRGLIEPIVVQRLEDGFEIVDGQKRWWAARLLGWRSIDATVKSS